MELLAPAGNLEKLKISFAYGADAVYLAGQQFGLRSAADNFTGDEMVQALEYAHKRGKKIYVTLNSFLFDDEIEALPEYVNFLEHYGADGVICSDLGVTATVRKYSQLPIHFSTQASVENSWHAKTCQELGVKRIVVGRELSIKEAAEIKENTDLEIEMFVHGAMCMSFSGNCLISNYIAGRDSNRGGCIQNCRHLYQLSTGDNDIVQAHFMSSKDLMGIRLLPEFLRYGIDSLKIEGRMKSNLYIATTVGSYSLALQQIRENRFMPAELEAELRKIPYRDYTDGALEHPPESDSIYNNHNDIGAGYEMAGTIIEIDEEKGSMAFHVRNRLTDGNSIEFLPFHKPPIQVRLSEMKNVLNKKIPIAQPNSIIMLPYQEGIAQWNVARVQ